MTQPTNTQREPIAKKKKKLTALKCMICHPLSRKYWVFGTGIFFLALAILVGFYWHSIAKTLLRHQLVFKDGSLGYKNWHDIPVPMYMKVKMFNWTNPNHIMQPNYKPHLVEMGPYVFSEQHTRVNVTIHPKNGTVTFDQIRTWHFMPEMSNGTLDDKVTNVNVVAASAAYTLRRDNYVKNVLTSGFMRVANVKLAVTKTVRELLFDGYSDPFLTTIKKLKLPNAPPFDKFAWFVGRNGSWTYDGHFEMYTGAKDITRMGEMTKWNHVKKTRYFRDECSNVKGTTGELWPMEMNPTGDISIFVTDLCRPLQLKYQKDYTHYGVTGSRWVGDERVFDNGENYPPNKCYSTGYPVPDLRPGLTNMSECRFGAPVFASFPHFYLADKSYLNAISGLNPNQEEHEFALALEPLTGITLKVDAKIQINTLIQKVPGLRVLGNIPTIMMPAFWMAQTLEIDEKLASEAKIASQLPSYGLYLTIGISSFSTILLVSGIILSCTKSWKADKIEYKNVDKNFKSGNETDASTAPTAPATPTAPAAPTTPTETLKN